MQAWAAINGIVKRLCTAPVSCANVRPDGDQLLHDDGLIGRRGNMQRGVALVHVMQNPIEVSAA